MSNTPPAKEPSQKKKSLLSSALQIIVPLALGVVILYFLYRDTDFAGMWHIIKNANWGVLTFSLIFGLSGNVIRGLRWELLINPLGYYPKRRNLIYAVLGNYAVNFAIPRAGEVWRCGVIADKEKIPFTKLIGTLIIDRMFDTIMVASIIAVAFLCNVPLFLTKSSEFNLPPMLTSVWFYAGCVGIVVLVLIVMTIFKETSVIKKIRNFLTEMWNDMKKVWQMKQKKRFFIYTFSIWLSYFLYFYVTFFAFGFTQNLGLAAGLFVFAISSVSMAIPSNGGLGPWQAAVVFGLCAFFVDLPEAKAFATAVFAFQSIWVALCGLYGIIGLSLQKKK
ncbi:uncharacterized protein (TIRG00374 family) [Dysgonomonas sp. PH5-45]|uniref:lysylphosphatidylglycerol synthase transmembrane domain-containing protein n=1 Tax=unclassified Dysgonomonas TaxID=2630389 RepID=UPI0024763008|nr:MULTISPECIES: lysylphosphatidylglycerol synthase transmembrane domain-containing protein [unclassified Dysgonomonas]MDH6355778.1 uncharacterized protein (TIRG00374 family) [Dysgonomonas sp. PH5-45]MDH6388661.1 uncharacterized protein (TIRG00374 family) [Dysgonomonas sp. PH5-37]